MNILLIHLGTGVDALAESLREFGHHVRILRSAADAAGPLSGAAPDVIVARLESDAAAALEVMDGLASQRALCGVPLLITGSNEVGITAARRRFPQASFARLDAVQTTLASIEAGE